MTLSPPPAWVEPIGNTMSDTDQFVEQLHTLGFDDAKVRVVEKVALDMARTLNLTLDEAQQNILLALVSVPRGTDG